MSILRSRQRRGVTGFLEDLKSTPTQIAEREAQLEEARMAKSQSTWDMKESQLYPIIKSFFEEKGYEVFAEVPFYSSSIDCVALKGHEIVGIELKMSLSQKVLHQAHLDRLGCHRTYAAVPTRPRDSSIKRAQKYGVGVLVIKTGSNGTSVVTEILPAISSNDESHVKDQIRSYCATIGETEPVGGIPNLKGTGPAISCAKRVKEYLHQHPDATWKELYENVDNHYAHHGSMRNAMKRFFSE
jgi:hypothetical protein